MDAQTTEERKGYRIAVQGQLDEGWSDWLGGITVRAKRAEDGTFMTEIIVLVTDQPALRGILTRLWDLNLTLISVNPVSKDPSREEASR